MVVNPSQIVWAYAKTQQQSEYLKNDVPSKKQVPVDSARSRKLS